MTARLDAPAASSSWAGLLAGLRERDDDPAYADAPCVDVYVRISRDPEGNLEKTDRQASDCLREVQRRGWRVGEVLADDNLSAWKVTAQRPQWETLCQRLKNRDTDGVIVWHTDRLMRQSRDLERLIDFGQVHGCRLASCHGDYDLSHSDDRFTLRVLTAAAAKESDNTSRRQRRKMAARRDGGELHMGARAFGFAGPGVSDEQVAAEREAIRWGSQAVLDGMALSTVAREWNTREYTYTDGHGARRHEQLHTARRGEPFNGPRVRAVLLRGRNAALIEHKGVTVGRASDVEPVVSEDMLAGVRAVISARRRGRPSTTRYLLSGLLRCGCCASGLTGYATSNGRRRYSCRNPSGCNRVSIDMRRTDESVRRATLKVLADPRHAAQVARRSKAVERVDAQIAEAEHTAREIGARLGRGDIDLDRHDAIMEPLDHRLDDLRTRRDGLLDEGGQSGSAPRAVEDLVRMWGEDDSPRAVEQRRVLVRQAFPLGLSVAPAAVGRGRFDPERIRPVGRRQR